MGLSLIDCRNYVPCASPLFSFPCFLCLFYRFSCRRWDSYAIGENWSFWTFVLLYSYCAGLLFGSMHLMVLCGFHSTVEICIILIMIDLFLFDCCDVFLSLFWRDKSVSGHSVTIQETLVASSADINGSTAFEVSGEIIFSVAFSSVPCCSLLNCVLYFYFPVNVWHKPKTKH